MGNDFGVLDQRQERGPKLLHGGGASPGNLILDRRQKRALEEAVRLTQL